MADNVVRRLIDAGLQFGEESQARTEKMVKELVRAGDIRRKDAEATIDALVARGRQGTERLLAMVQDEVARQMSRFSERIDDVEARLEDVADTLGMPARRDAPLGDDAGPQHSMELLDQHEEAAAADTPSRVSPGAARKRAGQAKKVAAGADPSAAQPKTTTTTTKKTTAAAAKAGAGTTSRPAKTNDEPRPGAPG